MRLNAFEVLFPAHWQISCTQNVSKLKPSLIDHARGQMPAPALRVEGANREGASPVEAIRSWRRNPERDGRIEYEVKREDDPDLPWELEENLKGAEDVLEEFKGKDAALQREMAGNAPQGAPPRSARKRNKGTAYVMEVEEDDPLFSEEGYLRTT